jgi:DNA-binding NtrC family response regulator
MAQLSPLRERLSDIPLLADHFLRIYCAEVGRDLLGFTDAARDTLMRYDWPGNVRELENVVERAVVLARGRYVDVDLLPEEIVADTLAQAPGDDEYRPCSLKRALEEPERRIIEQALRANNWNRQLTAEVLEINRTTLYKKMKRYGLEADPAVLHA